jgi:DNA primase
VSDCRHGIERAWCASCAEPLATGLGARSIKEQVPMELILELLGSEIGQTGYNGWTSVRCPFHGDERPSAAVSPDSQYFVCQGCDVRGDIFEIVIAAHRAKDFRGARLWIVKHALPQETSTTTNS